jgi:hypothetical protein
MSLKGSLAELQLPDLCEMMALGRKTGLLSLYDLGGAPAGDLAFREGLLVGATCGRLVGERAFYALLALEAGSFFVDPDRTPAGTRGVPVESLLMEGVRRLDEVNRLRQRLPSKTRLALAAPGTPEDDVEAQVVARLSIAGGDVGEIVGHVVSSGRADEYECLLTIDRLKARGLVAIVHPPALASS